jgi:hypothetical protein
MTIPQTFLRNFLVQVTAAEIELWRPGNVPAPVNADMVGGILDVLMGATEINLPPIVAGSTWSGVSVEFLLRPNSNNALRFPIYTWDIAADRKGVLVDLNFLISGAGARPVSLSRDASLLARIRPGSVATSTPIFIWGSAIEANQYGE